mgnify:CR=1 FL=1
MKIDIHIQEIERAVSEIDTHHKGVDNAVVGKIFSTIFTITQTHGYFIIWFLMIGCAPMYSSCFAVTSRF